MPKTPIPAMTLKTLRRRVQAIEGFGRTGARSGPGQNRNRGSLGDGRKPGLRRCGCGGWRVDRTIQPDGRTPPSARGGAGRNHRLFATARSCRGRCNGGRETDTNPGKSDGGIDAGEAGGGEPPRRLSGGRCGRSRRQSCAAHCWRRTRLPGDEPRRWLREQLDQRGASAVIPSLANRKQPAAYDKHMYRWRHPIENYFAKIKEFRGIATRYDKTDISYAANCNLVATIIAMR